MYYRVIKQSFSPKTNKSLIINDDTFAKTYTTFDLLCVGIGSTVGGGVFVLSAILIRDVGIFTPICWFIGGLSCLLSANSFAELSSSFPSTAGSYTMILHTLGEYPGNYLTNQPTNQPTN